MQKKEGRAPRSDWWGAVQKPKFDKQQKRRVFNNKSKRKKKITPHLELKLVGLAFSAEKMWTSARFSNMLLVFLNVGTIVERLGHLALCIKKHLICLS